MVRHICIRCILCPFWFILQHVKHFISLVKTSFFHASWVLGASKHANLIRQLASVVNIFLDLFSLLSYVLCVKIRVKMSFKHARDALVLCHDNGVIDHEEFCLL